ncbi:GAF domain-containing SpoIIE family protein phosphatase [Kitasatospora kifunensis]|uniref:GAF domain-containing protein n=1 Tax=Kitasatospora kifunensis TaxID=58351 RepID=A0A7W7VZ96_KITKI|nr:SpoIIE family protein phosphatase [Kitasatospora kifunensis]MBB4927465.1 GAF domain-containing protein [Kitasatospora kifunensis]
MDSSESQVPRRQPGAGEPGTGANLQVLARCLTAGIGELGAHMGGLYLRAADGDVLELAVLLGLPREVVAPWERIGPTSPVPVADALRNGHLVWVGGEAQMARRYPRVALTMPYAFCLAAVPLTAAGTSYGAIFVAWPGSHPAELSEQELNRLAALAEELAQSLARAAAAGRTVRADLRPTVIATRRDGGGLTQVLSAMVARLPEGVCALDLTGRISWVTPAAAELLGVPADRLLGAQPWSALPWLRDPVYEDRYRSAVVSQAQSSFVALRPPEQWLSFELYPDAFGLTVRVTAAEVKVEGTGAGEAEGTQQDTPMPRAAALPVLPTRTGGIYHILHLASALTEAVGVRDVVRLVAEQIVPAFGGQGVAILAVDGGRLRIVGHHGYPPGVVEGFDGTSLAASTPGVQALMTGVPSFIESREELERLYPQRPELQDSMAAWAYLPLVASGRLVGTCVLAFAQPHRFATDDRAVLTSVGGLIAQALDRARLYDTKLELARGLQESLLPHALPYVPGLRTAARYLPGTDGMEVGGDFFDVVRLGDDSAGAVIGDVQGHNVAAAVLMGQVRTAVRAYATAGADPSKILARTNRLMADLGSGLLTSCAYLRLDPGGRQAWLASAGHPMPLLRDPSGVVRVVEAPAGLLLGVEPTATYTLTRIALPVGSVVALYTDGLIEAPGVDLDAALVGIGEQLACYDGDSLDELADILVQHAEQAKRRTDDIALLLLRSVAF